MGSSCTTCCEAIEKDNKLGNNKISNDKIVREQNFNVNHTTNYSEEHVPFGRQIRQVSMNEMNRVNDKVLETQAQIGPYSADYTVRDSWRDLPELGPFAYADGSTYIGQYRKGERHGEGKMIGIDGSIYEGLWENDKRNGSGRFIHQDGDCYIGQWHDDKMHVIYYF